MESFSNKVAEIKACSVIKKTPTQVFSCEYYKIFKNICFEDHLQTAASTSWGILCKEFVDISYDNVSFGILEDSIWLQLIYFSTIIAFRSMKCFSNTLCSIKDVKELGSIYRSNQPLWKIHGIA